MIADGDQNVVALDWSYSNPDGTISNQHVLEKPYGTTSFDNVTEGLAVSWLTEQLKNTAAEFDAAIAERKEEVEYEQTLAAYEPHTSGPPTPMTTEVPADEIETAEPATQE